VYGATGVSLPFSLIFYFFRTQVDEVYEVRKSNPIYLLGAIGFIWAIFTSEEVMKIDFALSILRVVGMTSFGVLIGFFLSQ
jgi:glucan phosphoethanolaminetransferase (alkaline phosphatase superfamily)